MAKSDIQRFLEEEKERNVRKQELIGQLIQERDEAMREFDEQLTLLGYTPDVVGNSATAVTKRTRRQSEMCAICGFKTEPPHDGRLKAHRDQGDNKKPLTASQLETAELKRV